jgi:hypothetical protein
LYNIIHVNKSLGGSRCRWTKLKPSELHTGFSLLWGLETYLQSFLFSLEF